MEEIAPRRHYFLDVFLYRLPVRDVLQLSLTSQTCFMRYVVSNQ